MYCTHNDIENNICLNCGTTLYKKTENKISKNINFEKELSKLEIPLDIKQWVVKKSSLAKKQINRMGCRKQILFAYLYLAYLDLGYKNFIPEDLADILKISKKNIGISLKYVSGIASTLLPQYVEDTIVASLVIISPKVYLKKNLEKIEKIEYYNEIENYIEEKLIKNELLYEENPNLMCISLIKNFFDEKEIKIFKFYLNFDKTQSAIKKCIQKINL